MSSRSRRLIFWLGLVLVLLAGLVAWGFLWLRSSGRAVRSGTLRLPGLEAPVTVRWDGWAVPSVEAASSADLARAIGWLHANDRISQMELSRRAASGRLSELFGPSTLPIDKEFRTLRLRETARAAWETCSPESREWLSAYAGGVNAWLNAREGDLPPLFRLVGGEPEPWQPVDSLCVASLLSYSLSFAAGRSEEARFQWLGALGAERARDLIGDPGLSIPPGIAELAAGLHEEAEQARLALEPKVGGSNNWVLAGSRTAGGKPLLANDPHLRFGLPPVWYQATLKAPGYHAAGVTWPGLPVVMIGESPFAAWGFTNAMMDDHDFFLEKLDETGERVRRGEEWIPIETRTVEIGVSGAEPVPLRLRRTGRGPLFDADPEGGLPARSLSWTAYETRNPLGAFLGLARARDGKEALMAVQDFVSPGQNLVFADRKGGILHTVMGRMPRRLRGDGRLPSPGWDPAYGWDGLEPQSKNPRTLDPPEGLIATANADIRSAAGGAPFPADFDTPFRRDRILELLRPRSDWDVAGLAAVQNDNVSIYAREIVAALAKSAYEGDAARAMAVLEAWDASMDPAGPAALFLILERHLQQVLFGDEERKFHLAPFHAIFQRWRLSRLLRGEMDASWFDDVGTEAVETAGQDLARALADAWREGRVRFGNDDPRTWQVSAIHSLTLRHPLGGVPLIGAAFNRGPFAVAGSATTISAFGGSWIGGVQEVTYGPSVRFVADLGDPDRSRIVLPGGQAGQPWDPHYDDQIPLFLRGETRPMPWSEAAIEAATVSVLTLRP
ncbi:MAG: penicillin acylase family protein [Planctomycetota bacterium]